MRKFYGFIRGVFWLPFKIFYPTKVLNAHNMPRDERLISVTNHYSWKDIPVLAINVPGYRRFIAKKEIGKNKLVHKLADMLGVIFIDREKADMRAIRESINALKAGDGIAIFPEGTRNKSGDEALHEVKGGVTLLAIKGNAPIVPMILWKKERVFRKNYIYIGEPFDLQAFQGRLLDGEAIAAASEIVARHMQRAKDDMEVFIREKRWKIQKRERKERRKAERRANARAKKEYAAYLRSARKRRKAA
ncbi:MAG: 1-acyl-sn-glycerol-3-phosphate acyltransferase [Clostridiales bacterium]|nr:1-acyl-sn-glycerol-3-phosphate acyltransferase [Clostridiales bacterium]